MRIFALAFAVASLSSFGAHAADETRTLPKGRFGIILGNVYATGTDYEFGKDGSKKTVGETHATSIKDQALAGASRNSLGTAVFNGVVGILQATPTGQQFLAGAQNAVNQLDLGTMSMNVASTANVTSPTIMYGVTDKWSVIVNVPYVRLKTEVDWAYVPGKSNDALDSLSALANVIGITSIPNRNQFVGLAQQELATRGYKPPVSREKKFLGDIRLMNLVDLGRAGRLSFGTMNTLQLPTGPKHDPDDLFDAGSFHNAFIEQEFTAVYKHSRRFQSYYSGAFRYNLAQETDFRIPLDDQDLSPDKSQTETVKRQIGMGTTLEAGAKYRLFSRLQILGGLIRRTKAADSFSGNKGSNYDALERMYPYVAGEAYVYKLQLKYDPLSNYQPGSVPLMADISYEETFSGTNTPALKQLMFSIATFF